MKATLDQAAKILEVFKGTPLEQIQAILGSGLLTDLRDGNISQVNRVLFQKFLGFKPDPKIALMGKSPIGNFFMTVTLGTYKSRGQIEREIWDSGKRIGIKKDMEGRAGKMLSVTSISRAEKTVDIYELTGIDLGFTLPASRKEIFERAFEFGFEKCPAEIGPYVFIQCTDGKRRLVGMDPFLDEYEIEDEVFYLCGECDELQLDTYPTGNGYKWLPDFTWLFIWPRRQRMSI